MEDIPKRNARDKVTFTTGHKVLEALCLLVLLGGWVMVLAAYPALPEQIPTHFNAQGVADAWGDASTVFIMPVASVALYALMTAVGFVPGLWNLPVSREKLTRDALQRVLRATLTFLLTLKLSMLLTFVYITYGTVAAGGLDPAFLPVFIAVEAILVVCGIARILWVSRAKYRH